MPTQARDSMRVLETVERGLTAYARHPNGMMPMMEGFSPDASSYEVTRLPGGHDVLFSMSTACATA
eukprot:5123613-Pleurochrysis_carterae.AAC.1